MAAVVGARRAYVGMQPPVARFMASGGVVWVLVVGLVGASAALSSDFRTFTNLSNVSHQAVVPSLVSLGQFLVVLTGGVDLSVGAVVKITALSTAITIGGFEERTLLGIGIALLLGLAVGACNGALVVWFRIPPFIATFGTLAVVQGASLLIASTPRGQVSQALSDFWAWQVGELYVVVGMTALLWTSIGVALQRTVWGRHVYAVGGDSRVAAMSGIRTSRVRFSVYVLASLLAAAGGILTASRAGIGDPNAGFGLEFESLAAVVIGGVSLAGGRGRAVGALGGVILLTLIENVFNLVGIDVWYQQLLKGSIILLGAAVYVARRDRRRA
jgi:ribose transport system permease protein